MMFIVCYLVALQVMVPGLQAAVDTQPELEVLKHQLKVLQEQQYNTQKQLDNTQTQLDNTQKQLENTQEQQHGTQKQLDNTQKQQHDTQKQLDNTQKQQHDTQKQLENTQKQLKNTQEQQHDTQKQLDNTQKQQHDTQKQLEKTQKQLVNTNSAQQSSLNKLAEMSKSQANMENILGDWDTTQGYTLWDAMTRNKVSTYGVVAFSAHRTNGLYQAGPSTEPIIFDVTDFIIGPGYDEVTSLFTAPVSGVYVFAASVRDNNAQVYTYISINGVYWRFLEIDTPGETVSASGVALLQAGDIVSVDLGGSLYINCANNGCHFDGYLLYEQL